MEITTANIVASGKLDLELDLASVAEDLTRFQGIIDVEHSRRHGNRLLIRFDINETLGILAPTGSYVFTGATAESEIYGVKKLLLSALSKMGIISDLSPQDCEVIDPFEIQNYVFTSSLERSLNLGTLAISLGLENTEYEPEQFPGLVYRPLSDSCTILLFSSGKIVVTGVSSKEVAQDQISNLKNKIDKIQ